MKKRVIEFKFSGVGTADIARMRQRSEGKYEYADSNGDDEVTHEIQINILSNMDREYADVGCYVEMSAYHVPILKSTDSYCAQLRLLLQPNELSALRDWLTFLINNPPEINA